MDASSGFFLAGIVLLSLVLPLTASARPLAGGIQRRPLFPVVWSGQLLIALGGVWIIAVPLHPAYGFVFAVAGCLGCLFFLRRQFRPT
jgi:hypothetical protein